GLEESVVERVLVENLRNAQRAIDPAPIGPALLVGLEAPKQRRHVLPAPAARPHLGPGVVVERLAAHPHQSIDGAGPPQQFTAWYGNGPVCRVLLRFRGVEPVRTRIIDQQPETDRKARIGMAGAPGFDEQY